MRWNIQRLKLVILKRGIRKPKRILQIYVLLITNYKTYICINYILILNVLNWQATFNKLTNTARHTRTPAPSIALPNTGSYPEKQLYDESISWLKHSHTQAHTHTQTQTQTHTYIYLKQAKLNLSVSVS